MQEQYHNVTVLLLVKELFLQEANRNPLVTSHSDQILALVSKHMPFDAVALYFLGEKERSLGAAFAETRNGPAQARVMTKSVLSSAEHGRCPHKY